MQCEKNQPELWRQIVELQPSQLMEQQFLGLQTSTEEPAKGAIYCQEMQNKSKVFTVFTLRHTEELGDW